MEDTHDAAEHLRRQECKEKRDVAKREAPEQLTMLYEVLEAELKR